jgi:hypothetical protein
VWPRIIHKSNKKLQKCNTRENRLLGHMRRRLRAATVTESHVGQVVTAGAIAQARIAEAARAIAASKAWPMAVIEVTVP